MNENSEMLARLEKIMSFMNQMCAATTNEIHSAHPFQYTKNNYCLRSPNTQEEWEAYHHIRKEEIHTPYCSGLQYNVDDPEETQANSFRFIFVEISRPKNNVVGGIRIDLLNRSEASLRWVGITRHFQGKSAGRCMIGLAETFICEQERTLIRIPATEASRGFYEKLGYVYRDWPNGPHCGGDVPLAKAL